MNKPDSFYPIKFSDFFPVTCIELWMTHGERISFKKGEFIQTPDKLSERVLLVISGHARLFHLNMNGKECVLGIATEGDFIDLLHVFSDRERHLFSKALTDVTIISLSKQEVKQAVQETPELAMAIMHYLTNKLEDTIEVLEQVAYEKVEERLLFQLKKLANHEETSDGWALIPSFVTHKDIAGMIASTRETVTFLLNKLTQTGEVKQFEQRIWVPIDFFI